jgi:hypothetical protein
MLKILAHPRTVWSVAFAPDGARLASASEDGSIRIWSLPTSIQSGNQQETIRRFFRLIGILADRPDVDYLRVTENYRVMVKVGDTIDGIPLELLSQGMTSLFGWVGVLCQRLKETLQVPTNDPLPASSYALVLIDELDAHMHPRWQQVIVTRLKRAFPNVQFVACTHSPLIVGGLTKEEVDRFALDEGKVVKVDFDADMTMGRADQLLTGELFGLETTLDSVTQEIMQRYETLLGLERNPEQEAEFQDLAKALDSRIPPVPSNLVARRAAELIDAYHASGEEFGNALVRERLSQLAKALAGKPAHSAAAAEAQR